MGLDPVTAGIILSVAGSGLGFLNNRRALRRQDRAAANLIRKQRLRQQEADALTQAAINRAKASDASAERSKAQQELDAQIAAARQRVAQEFQQPGAVSDRFDKEASDAALGVIGDATSRANLLSTVDAGTRQRFNEAIDRSQLESALRILQRLAAGDRNVGQIRLQSIQPSPLLGFLSSGLRGAGTGVALRGLGGLGGGQIAGQPLDFSQFLNPRFRSTSGFGSLNLGATGPNRGFSALFGGP